MKNKAGQNWILLRGLIRESGHWGSFLPQLQQAFPQAQIHTLDLPGSGIYYQDLSPDSISGIAQQVRLQAQKNGWLEQKITLLTLSLGGMVAWEWLQQYPDEIEAAILMNSSLATLNPFYHRLRWQCYLKLAQIVLQPDCYKRELAIVKLVSNLEERNEEEAIEWAKIQILHPVSKQNAFRQIIAAARYTPNLNKPIPPVLLLNGSGDRLVSPFCSESISKRWAIPVISHPWAGHDLCIDDAKWIIAQLQQWLDGDQIHNSQEKA
jgi:pimeloyl-ACP methyl ester carboxylesterase